MRSCSQRKSRGVRPPPHHPLMVTRDQQSGAQEVRPLNITNHIEIQSFKNRRGKLTFSVSYHFPNQLFLCHNCPSMADSPDKLLENGLLNINRYITTTDSSGKSILSNDILSTSIWQKIGSIANFFLGYTTRTFPVLLSSINDISSYNKDLSSPPGLTVSSGTVLRYVDMAPHTISPMHKTASLDYGIVLEGEIELVLDSGETQLMRRGDICVQRGTNHA